MDIFISRPTKIASEYEKAYSSFEKLMVKNGMKVRRLGGSDTKRIAPLIAVMNIIGECKGAVILGYPQLQFRNTSKKVDDVLNEFSAHFPTPWNQIEAALSFSRHIPVLVIAHTGIKGGVFDYGITGEFVLETDLGDPKWFLKDNFTGLFNEWFKDVTEHQEQ